MSENKASRETSEVNPAQGSMAPRTVLGNYKDPKAAQREKERVAAKKVDDINAAKSLVESVTTEMSNDVEENKETIERAKSYEEILAENEIELSKARAIIDDLLMQGFYQEDIALTQSAYVTFRTRTQADYRRFLRALEIASPKFMDEQREIQMRYFIAASLVSFKGRTFEHPEVKIGNEKAIETAFTERLNWLNTQPETLVTLIATKLVKFDRMIQIVTSEGVIENF